MRGIMTVVWAALLSVGVAGAAQADVIYTFNTGSNGNANQEGTATFDFSSANSFTVTLTNTGTITSIASVLDGLTFTESGGGTVGSISLTALSATDGSVNCTTGTCIDTSPGAQPTTDWAVSHGTGATANDVTMIAGSGNHPHGIVNDTIDANVGLDGLTNAQHNPYLEGPATFTITTTGETSIPTISNLVFEFGTTPTLIDGVTCTTNCGGGGGGGGGGSVPEPSPLAVMGIVLTGLALVRWRKSA